MSGVADAPNLTVAVGAPTTETSGSYSDVVAAGNPIAYFELGETSGTTAVDSAGNHDGTYTNGVSLGADGIVSGSTAASFDGSNDFVEIPHSDDMLLDSGTVTMWFKADDLDGTDALFSKDSSGFDDGGHITARVVNGEVQVRLQSDDESHYVSGGSVAEDEWHQITFTFGGDGMQLYLDGELVDSDDYTGGLGTTSGDDENHEPWTLGASQVVSGNEAANNLRNYFDGELDEFAIYDHAMNADDIQSLYTAGVNDGGGEIVNSFPLDIDAALVDTDSSESLSITVGGVPGGATLSAGTDNGNGIWTLSTDDLDGLTIKVDAELGEDFALSVTATSSEADGDSTASTTATVTVDVPVESIASAPDLTTGNVSGAEDGAIALNISAALTDTDGSESLSIEISDVPVGATLTNTAGDVFSNATSFTLTADQLNGLTITPPANSDVDFQLKVTATSTESAGGDQTAVESSFNVAVSGVADAPNLTVAIGAPTTGPITYSDEVTAGNPIAYYELGETSGTTAVDSVGNHDGTYTNGVSLGADGIVSGSTAASFDGSNDFVEIPHSDDMLLDNGTVTMWFKADDLDGTDALFSKDSSNFDDGGHITARVVNGELEVRLQSDDESYYVSGGTVAEDEWHQITLTFGGDGMQLYLDGELVDSDDYTGGLGTTSGDDGNHEPWTLGASQVASGNEVANNLRDHFDGELDEFAIYDHAMSADDIQSLYTAGVNDGGDEIVNSFPLDIDAALVDTDGSESLSITVDGVPEGATLSAGTDNGNGTWTLSSGQLNGLTIRVDKDLGEDFALSVTATSSEADGDSTASTTTTVTVDVPAATAHGFSFEGTSGEDVLIGAELGDTLRGSGDEAILMGRGGDDVLEGGNNDDQLFGGEGNDTFHSGSGTDIIHLAGADGGLPNGEWTISLTSGEINSEDDDHWHLTSGATGTITFADGSTLAFDSVERIDWSDHVKGTSKNW